MAEGSLLAGSAIRRVRRREGLTQADMAARLSISPSYLNLIERNRRALSAQVALRLMREFAFDPSSIGADEAVGGREGLARRLSDERFADLGIDRDDIDELLTAMPQFASAFARIYDSDGGAQRARGGDPFALARFEIDRWRNHFAEIDLAAEELADTMRLSRGDIALALAERLRERHQFAVRTLPADVMQDTLSRLDLHARQLQLSEMLSPSQRAFELARQIGRLEQAETFRPFLSAAGLRSDETARRLFERHLLAYFAAAVLMPYRRFLRACNATGYDLPVLERRFGVSFEQLAHRLTTLQRVGERGLPFFMARIDRAGQFSKRFVGASRATFIEAEDSCPLWNLHDTFAAPGDWRTALIDVDGNVPPQWLTVARTVDAGTGRGEARFAVVIGVEAELAAPLAHRFRVSLLPENAVPTGQGCHRCRRARCYQRSLPPGGVALSLDPSVRCAVPLSIASR
jgi:predicted transcriptional regulator/DNA-binding XRE family transcriptional regulator